MLLCAGRPHRPGPGLPRGQATEVSQGSLWVRRQKAFPGCQQRGNPGPGDVELGSDSGSRLGCGSFREEEAGGGAAGASVGESRGVGRQAPVGVQPLAVPHSSSLSWAGLGQPLCGRVCLVGGDRRRLGSSRCPGGPRDHLCPHRGCSQPPCAGRQGPPGGAQSLPGAWPQRLGPGDPPRLFSPLIASVAQGRPGYPSAATCFPSYPSPRAGPSPTYYCSQTWAQPELEGVPPLQSSTRCPLSLKLSSSPRSFSCRAGI